MSRTLLKAALICLALGLLLGGCSGSKQDKANAIRLGYTPSDLAGNERGQAFEALRSYLQAEVGLPVELVRTGSSQPAILAMQSAQIDIMTFGSQAYLIAEDIAGAEAFAVRGQPDGQPRNYFSILIVPAESPLQSIEDIKNKASELKMLYTDEASTSGYLVATAFLSEHGLSDQDFASSQFTGSHALSILKIAHREADIACVNNRTLRKLVAQSKVDPESIRILWESRPIPTGPVAYRSSLPDPVKQRIREAYYQLPQRSPATHALLAEMYPEETFVYIPPPEKSLSWLRAVRYTEGLSSPRIDPNEP